MKFQRRRRMMSNQHNPKELAILNEFWASVDNYFNNRFLTLHGAELLRKTELTRELVSIPTLGRKYTEVWAQEDEEARANSSRSGRVTARNANELPVSSPMPSPASPQTPASSPLPSSAASIAAAEAFWASDDEVGADAESFAEEGKERLHAHLKRYPEAAALLSAEEIADLERLASKPHTAAITILAMIGSTAVKSEKKEEPSLIFDPDAKEPFDRHSFFFPAAHANSDVWAPPVAKRTENAPTVELSLDAAAEQVFKKATPAQARFLTGADKDKKKALNNNATHIKASSPETVAAAAAPAAAAAAAASSSDVLMTDDATPAAAASAAQAKSKAKNKADAASASPLSSAPILIRLPSPAKLAAMPLPSPSPSPPAASANASASSQSSPLPSQSPSSSVSYSPLSSPPPASASTAVPMDLGDDDAPAPSPSASPVAPAPPQPAEREVGSPSKRGTTGGKKPRSAAPAAAAAAAPSTAASSAVGTVSDADEADMDDEDAPRVRSTVSGKAPHSAAASSSSSAAGASAPHAPTGGKVPRNRGGAAGASSSASSSAKPAAGKAPRAKGDQVKLKKRSKGSDDDESSGEGSEEDDEKGMTLSEEEDMREELEDAADAAEAAPPAAADAGGHGAGKTAAAQAASAASAAGAGTGKQPRGSSGPVTSDRVFSMAPRRNDDVAVEEEVKTEPVEDNLMQLATPFFDLRSLDLTSWRETGMVMPHPKLFKMQHEAIVDELPFVNKTMPALLASSCHYSQPPLLYNSQTLQLQDADEADESKDSIETLSSVQAKLVALQAEMDIVEIKPQEDIGAMLPTLKPAPPTQAEIQAQQAAALEAEKLQAEQARVKKEEEEKAAANLYGSKFSTTAAARRSRGAPTEKKDQAAAASASSLNVIELDTSDALASAASVSLSLAPTYDDEVSAELWLVQRQFVSQANHNNFVRGYLWDRAHASGDWKVNVAQIEHKEKQDHDTEELYEESFFLQAARDQREQRKQRADMTEAGQIRNIKKWERTQERNARHIQRLMKSMIVEVERRDKKRAVNDRRSQSAAQRAAKRDRRAALEASWKSRKDQEIYRRCENSLDQIIKQIERAVEGKVSKSHHKKAKDPNAPHKKKIKEPAPPELFCICRTPYDNDRFYLGCESCQGWYHGKCVHITEEQAAYIQDYICEACEKATGRTTTYTDSKKTREIRRMKQSKPESEEEESETESEEDSEEESEDELLRPIRIRRIRKKGRRTQYAIISPSDDEESGSGSGTESEEEDSGDDGTGAKDASSSSEEESDEEDNAVPPIKLHRVSSNMVRLQRLADAVVETKTRHAAAQNVARYNFLGQSAVTALYVDSDHPHHEQSARLMLRRFRRVKGFYPELITLQQVATRGITPSRALGQKPRKVSAYTYRSMAFKVARVDKTNLVVTIRKISDAQTPAAAAPLSSTVDSIECPLCKKACDGDIGLVRHHVRAHPDEPKPDAAAIREAQRERSKPVGKGRGSVAPAAAAAAPTAAAAAPASKRKRGEDVAAAAARPLANVSVKLGSEGESKDGAQTPRGAKRARAAAPEVQEPEPASKSTGRGRRGATATPVDTEGMSDAEPNGSGSNTRGRRGRSDGPAAASPAAAAASSSSAVSRRGARGEPPAVGEVARVVPFKLKIPAPDTTSSARKSPQPPPDSSPSLTPGAGNKFKIMPASGSKRATAASPLADIAAASPRARRGQSNGTEEKSQLNPNAAASPAAAGKRKRGGEESPAPAAAPSAAASAAPSGDSALPVPKKPRGRPPSNPIPQVPLFDAPAPSAFASPQPPAAAASAAASALDTLDIVKMRNRQPVNKFAP